MFPVQSRRLHQAQKELRSIGMWSRIRHRQNARSRVLQFEVLVCKVFCVNRFIPSAIVMREISSLTHKARNHSVE